MAEATAERLKGLESSVFGLSREVTDLRLRLDQAMLADEEREKKLAALTDRVVPLESSLSTSQSQIASLSTRINYMAWAGAIICVAGIMALVWSLFK